MSDTTKPITITMGPRDQRFYQGVAAAGEVLDAHAEIEFPDEQARLALFWFYVGALAAGEHGCSTNEDFEPFLLGVSTRAPQPKAETGR